MNPSRHVRAAIEVDDGTGEVAGLIGRQERDHVADFLRRPDPAHWNRCDERRPLRFAPLLGQRRRDPSGRYAVHRDATGSDF